MVLRNILLAIISFHIAACGQKVNQIVFSEDDMELITVEDIGYSEVFLLSNIAKGVKIVPLAFSPDYPIGEVKRIRIWQDKVFIQDLHHNQLFVFDTKGVFITKIGQSGRGPEEYGVITDFDVDDSNGDVFIYDNMTQHVFIYSQTGEFQKKVFISRHKDFFRLHDDGFVLYRMNPELGTPYELEMYSATGSLIWSYFEGKPEEMGSSFPVFGEGLDKTILFSKVRQDTVFRISGDDVRKAFCFDFGPNRISDEHRALLDKEPLRTSEICMKNNYAHAINGLLETEDYLFFRYTYGVISYDAFYDKEEKACFHSNSVLDDVSYLFFATPKTLYDGNLVGVYDNVSFIESNVQWIKEKLVEGAIANPESAKQTLRVLEGMARKGFDNNPILVFYKL